MSALVKISTHSGRFNVCDPHEVRWLFTIETPHGRAWAYFNEEPRLPDGFGVEDAVMEMRRLYEGIFYQTGKAESLKVLDAVMDDLPRLELDWHEGLTAKYEAAAERARDRLNRHNRIVEMLRREVAEAAA